MNPEILILISCLIAVESGGDPEAVGDNGKAIGILQIHDICIRDVNRIYKTKYQWPRDARDPKKARYICYLYLSHYGKGKSIEARARIWNGGPRGYKKKATLPYWEKVKKIYEEKKR